MALSIAVVGWEQDQTSGTYRRSLVDLAKTMRADYSGTSVVAEACDATTPEELTALLETPVDVLIYSGHAGVDQTGFYLTTGTGKTEEAGKKEERWLHLAHIGTVNATVMVLDCCHGAEAKLAGHINRPVAVLACNQIAPFTHGPVLLPMVLARLCCPKQPPIADAQSMAALIDPVIPLAKEVWRGDFIARWAVQVVQPARD